MVFLIGKALVLGIGGGVERLTEGGIRKDSLLELLKTISFW